MSDSGTERWVVVLWLATSLGVPSAILAIFKEDLRGHLGVTLTLSVLWGIFALISGVLIGVWKKTQKLLEDRLFEFLDLGRRLTRYRRRYLDWVFYQHRDFDVKGLSTQGTYNLELEQVFVDLSIEAKPAHKASRFILRFPEVIEGRHQIWEYLESENIDGQDLVLIGPPGSGKTTLLKKVALQMTGKRRLRIRQSVPVLIFLRDHAELISKDPAFKLTQAIVNMLSKKEGPLPPEGWFEAQLGAGKCLVLLDGLDEVAEPKIREAVVQWVETQMKGHAKNRFIVSSRPHGYRNNPIAGVTVLEVQPFTRNQVRDFVAKWYRANEIMASHKVDPGVDMKAREGASDLLRRLGKSQTLTDLAVNPLLLTMIATIHRYKSSLPGRRVELYAEICEVFLGKRQQASGLESNLTPAQKQVVLQPLAYHMMIKKKREIETSEALNVIKASLLQVSGEGGDQAGEAFFKEIEDRSGLLLERETGIYGFAHLAFQEYLAAVHIKEQGLVSELVQMIGESWWHEVIRLYGAQSDVSPILAKCLSPKRPTIDALSLAIDCLEEAQKVDVKWRERLNNLVSIGAEDDDPERFKLAAETLLARRIQHMISVDQDSSVDNSYVSHAEYQLFIDDMRGNYRPDHWSERRFERGAATLPLVGLRRSDAKEFCVWLNSRYESFRFRIPHRGETSILGIDLVSPKGGTCQGYWVIEASEEGKQPHCFERSEELPSTLADSYVQRRIAEDFRMVEDVRQSIERLDIRNRGKSRYETQVELIESDQDIRRVVTLFDVGNKIHLEPKRALQEAVDVIRYSKAFVLDFDGLDRLEDPLGVGPALSYDRAMERDRNFGRNLTEEFAKRFGVDEAIRLASSLNRLCGRALDREMEVRNRLYFCWATRLLSLALRIFFINLSGVEALRSREANDLGLKDYIDKMGAHTRLVYTLFFLLQARMEGQIPALEGLRLIKVRTFDFEGGSLAERNGANLPGGDWRPHGG